jgi:rhodanese-related sulfurtransferase/DNA-binding transcriptional ArsR family regulator
MAHDRSFKQRVHAELARIGQALSSERRLDLIDLLAQSPRNVEALASLTGVSVASTSQHLQALRGARLVESERDGTKIIYRLADDSVPQLWIALCQAARRRLPEIERIERELAAEPTRDEEVAHGDVQSLVRRGEAVLVDVRPPVEFQYGHVPGAISIPAEELPQRLGQLPCDKRIVAYCRGTYCMSADEAVALLREHGFDAVRMEGGWPEWRSEGRKTSTGP